MTVKTGSTILKSEPYVHILSQNERSNLCSSCLKRSTNLKKCSRCCVLKYCGISCQREDWEIHKEECGYLQQVAPNIPLDSVMLMLRLIIKHKKSDFGKSEVSDSRWNRNFNNFMTHKADIETDEERRSQFSQILFTLQKLAGNSLPPVSEIFEIFCKMTLNSFTICDGELNPVGVGIYLSPSLIDHSCHPNSVVTFSGKSLSVRALEEIDDPSPDNVRISYIDQLALTSDRQEQLNKQYYFTCTCPRCTNTDLDQKMLCVKCPTINCDKGYIEKLNNDYLPCSCGHVLTEEETNCVHKYEDTIFKSLESLKIEKKLQEPPALLQSCEDCKKLEFFCNFNIYCVQILDIGLDACIDSGNWSQALSYTGQLIEPYRCYYPGNSPQTGLLLMKQGKIQLYLSRLKEALISLQGAGEIIQITHGKAHDLYKELQSLLDQCMEEMRVSLEFGNTALENRP